MKLYFLRHGLAGERAEWSGDDYARPLTSDGRKRMAREADAMKALQLTVDCIITSPLVRAYQTAEIVAQRLGMPDKLRSDELLEPGFDAESLKELLKKCGAADAVMLVGHEPDFSSVISRIIGGGRVICKKGGLACVALRDPAALRGDLLWLIPPKVLAG
jgi:phosphohistidine phosphatase